MRVVLLALLASLSLVGCEEEGANYDSGYSDGYATGFNTTCKIRMTLIYGHFDNEEYSEGYRDGYASGADACRNQGR